LSNPFRPTVSFYIIYSFNIHQPRFIGRKASSVMVSSCYQKS
jgi:hypothetical protein